MSDRLSELYGSIGTLAPNPWTKGGIYQYDRALLERLLQVLVDNGKIENAQTGGAALAVDVWVACELRRAGIDAEIVWPRATLPRTLPQSLAAAADKFKYSRRKADATIQRQAIEKLMALAGSSRTSIVGGQFPKEVDVVIAKHDRGLEVAISTKAMTDSYGKNITNRWEEASGDLLNIRRRFPLASFGFAFLVTTGVLTEPSSFERVKDMLRKLTTVVHGAEGTAYDAACLLLADWSSGTAQVDESQVPEDLAANAFFDRMLRALFSRSPVSDHATARQAWLASNPPDAPI
jgi:hypothetical protein